MRKWMLGLGLLLTLFVWTPGFAEIGTGDAVPAATLLVPYFEVDLGNPNGITTLFSINNASASAAVAHVTFWTDQAIPTLAFDVYLTGYDVQTINIRDIFNGVLPLTADAGADPADNSSPTTGISNKGVLSQDINFPGSVGPCGSAATLYNAPDPTLPPKIANMNLAHTGKGGPLFGGKCSGAKFGDNIARGYITVDSVTQCNLQFPSDTGYFAPVSGIADNRNILWGDYFYVNSGQNFAQGDTLVHIEACSGTVPPYIGYVGNGAGHCPFVPGDYTFYGRYVGALGTDQREPLATTWATRYINGGNFNGGTTLIVWRDTKTTPSGVNGPYNCGASGPSWFPLNQTDVVAFDEQENPTDLCAHSDNVAPVLGGFDACFPQAAQRTSTVAPPLATPAPFGWLYLNLNFALASGDPYPGRAQSWVSPIMDASGRFSVGFHGVALDNALNGFGSGVVLIP